MPEPVGALPPELESLSQAWSPEFAVAWANDPHSEHTMQALHGVLKQRLGNGYMENVDLARQVVQTYAPAELKAALNSSGLGNDPTLVMFLSSIGVEMQRLRQENERLRQGMPVVSSPSDLAGHQQVALTSSLDKQIEEAMRDPSYWNRIAMGHKAAVARVETLFRQRYSR